MLLDSQAQLSTASANSSSEGAAPAPRGDCSAPGAVVGDDCVIDAGRYVTTGTKVVMPDGGGIALNEDLHAN